MTETTTVTKIWNRTFIAIFITNMLFNLAEQMVQPIISSYVKDLGATQVIIGMVAGSFAITALLFKVISAPAIDTFNKKYILFVAMLAIAVAYIGFGAFRRISSVFGFRLLQGAGKAFVATCCLAMATDALPQDKLGQGIGVFSLAQAICQAAGPTIGKFIQQGMGFRTTFFTAATIMLIGAFSAISMRYPFVRTRQFKISIESMIAKEAVMPATVLFLLAMCNALINSFLFIYAATRLTEEQNTYIGFYFTVYAITLLFSRPIFGRLCDKYGTVKVVVPAMLAYAVSFYILSAANTLWIFLIAAFVSAFGYGSSQPALNALSMRIVPADKRGAGSCTNYIGTDLGQLLGPTLGGFLSSIFGYPMMWALMTVAMYAGIAVVLLNRKKINHYDFDNRQPVSRE